MENFSENLKSKVEMEPPMELLAKATAYFRSRSGFRRLLDGLVEKYLRLGRIAGVIVLENISPEERQTLEGFFRRRLPGTDLRFSTDLFRQALAQTRFGLLDPLDLLAAWHGEALITRTEQRENAEQKRQKLLQQLMAEHPAPVCQEWLKAILDKNPKTRQVQRNLAGGYDFMAVALKALANLPQNYQRLPIFARKICGDPHGLDMDRSTGKLFLEGLRFLWDHRDEDDCVIHEEKTVVSATEELNELLYHFKLLRDDLLNLATCFGLIAYEGTQEILYWKMAAVTGAPLNVPLREIVRVTEFYPCPVSESSSRLEHRGYDVFIVENSSIFSALLDECASNKLQLVCLHGQFKLASWALLDRLAQSGAVFYYSGDFDPEGLQMADKLIRRYPERAHLWRMTEADYLQAAPSVPLREDRIAKLKSITGPELGTLAKVIADKGLTAYQEGILAWLIEDIKLGRKKPNERNSR